MEKKFLNMKKNVLLGLSWIFFPFAIVALAVEHKSMDKEDKTEFIQVLVFEVFVGVVITFLEILAIIFARVQFLSVIFTILSVVASVLFLICLIMALVKSFKGNHFEVPVVYGIAKKFVK